MNEERLRRLYQRAADARAPGDRDGCPAPEQLLALADGTLSPHAAREALADHLATCPACRSDYEYLRVVEEAAAPTRRRPRALLALAASVALVAGTTLLVRSAAGPGEAGPVRGTDGPAVELVAPAGMVRAGAPLVFAWRPRADAAEYVLELFGPDGRVLFTSRATDTTLTLPDSVRLAPAEYQWTLRARAGAEASAGFGRFTIR